MVPVYRTLADLHPAAEEPYQVNISLGFHNYLQKIQIQIARSWFDFDYKKCLPQLTSCKRHSVCIIIVISQVVLVNKKKWTVAGEVLASRGERQKDVMDIFQVLLIT